MASDLNRRDALKAVISAGTMAMVQPVSAAMPDAPLSLRSERVELALTAVSAQTVRITVQPVRNGSLVPMEADGGLLDRTWPQPVAQIRSLSSPYAVRSGHLTISVAPHPLRISIKRADRTTLQELLIDEYNGALEFNIAGGLLLGLGQGGPQFDRRGQLDSMVSGEAGFHLGTHGARVPIQLLLGTAGWGIFFHAPLGAFDLSGNIGD